jgi:hypothetical protein
MDAIETFLPAVTTATVPSCAAWTADATVDATVPNWRFRIQGADSIRAEYARWFADAAEFEALRRLPTPDGEVVEYTLTWLENGVPHAAHHVHVLTLRDGLIAADTVVCGGRWPAALLAEMEAAGA